MNFIVLNNHNYNFIFKIPIPDFDLMEPKIFEEQLRYIVQLLKYIDKREVGYCRQKYN